MRRIVVTGASGTIGRRLTVDLARDFEIVRVDRRDGDLACDVNDLEALCAAFAGCYAVVHLAANAALDAPWDDVFATNIGGTYNVFEAARRAGCAHAIFASSNHVVGGYERAGERTATSPLSDVAPPRPDSLYAVAKIFGEALGRYYSDTFGLCVACVRIGSMNESDSPTPPQSRLPWRRDSAGVRRLAATWFSHADLARLVRAILARDVPFAIVYGVGDNRERFWDLEPGRAAYDFWPKDGTR